MRIEEDAMSPECADAEDTLFHLLAQSMAKRKNGVHHLWYPRDARIGHKKTQRGRNPVACKETADVLHQTDPEVRG